MWIEIEYKNYSYGEDPTIHHAIIDSDMITEFHIEDKTIKGHSDLYYELTNSCFDCLMRNLNAGKYAVKMYGEDADIDDFVNKLCGGLNLAPGLDNNQS